MEELLAGMVIWNQENRGQDIRPPGSNLGPPKGEADMDLLLRHLDR
jgi:hypothetical protein